MENHNNSRPPALYPLVLLWLFSFLNDRHFMRYWSVFPGYRLHEGDQLHPPYANELDFYGDTNCWSATTGRLPCAPDHRQVS